VLWLLRAQSWKENYQKSAAATMAFYKKLLLGTGSLPNGCGLGKNTTVLFFNNARRVIHLTLVLLPKQRSLFFLNNGR
jgi:hypothetical protein